ncbi:MAG: hypothetical protein HZC54_04415 [Verrucomicrobia bacterium]|nr:hypothetical protein [Verrucomicrobiota bacterium]
MNKAPNSVEKSSRRQFLRRSVGGASLFGLGGASALLSFPAQAEKPAAGASSGGGRSLGKEFTYDVSKFYKTDPALIHYAESSKIATGFKELHAVATGPEDRVYAAGDQAVRVFSKTGERVSEFGLSEKPRCLAVATAGNIFVGMKNRVEVFDASGARQARWAVTGGDAVLTAVAVVEKDVFVADAGNRVVLRYDLAGKLLGRIGKKDPERHILGFIVPSPYLDLNVGADGLLWVVNPGRHRLEAYTFDGEIRNYWGEESLGLKGFCGCCNPIHFARLPDGRFVTSEKGLPRVKVYSAQGDFEGVVAGPELFPNQIENPNANATGGVCMDLAVDSAGRVLLADAFLREVRVFTRKK